jgi:putative tricarboxylic transport membrane protein
LANILTLAIAVGIIPWLIKILSVPVKVLIPCIIVVCLVGSYSTTYSLYGVIIMLVSGILGYILEQSGYSTAPMLLAFVLSPMLESNMRKSFIISHGSLRIFFEKPIACVLMIILFAIVLVPVTRSIVKAFHKK